MTITGASRFVRRVESFFDRPPARRASLVMSILVAGQAVTVGFSALVLHGADVVDERVWLGTMVAIVGYLAFVALSLKVVALRDPDAGLLTTRFVMMSGAVGYALSGVAMAYVFGFWVSAFTLVPLVWVILVAITFGRAYAIGALLAAGVATVLLETLRFTLGWQVAPAVLPFADERVGSWQLAMASAVPVFAYAAVTSMLAFAVLSLLDRRRAALATSHDVIRRYVPAQVADAVLQDGEASTRLERRKLTIFFSDVVGFTELTERMEPEELARVLDDYFSEMTRIAEVHDGTIDELIGDAVLIFFGAPTATTDHDHALRAVRMAVEMQAAVERLNDSWEADGIDAALRIRVGVNTGIVMVGNVGSGERRKYAALGRAVNLAARVQTHCPPGDVLLSRATWLLVRDDVVCSSRGEVELKGVGRPTELYAVDRQPPVLDRQRTVRG